jgi:hypothetical protein
MIILSLGVIEQQYDDRPIAPKAKIKPGKKAKRKKGASVSTGDVAEWLEDKYHVMEIFAQVKSAEIEAAIEASLEKHMLTLLMGGEALGANALVEAQGDIEKEFRYFIDSDGMNGLYKGVPTQAALDGINHRLANPRTGNPRPSFLDTGLYQASFRAEFK